MRSAKALFGVGFPCPRVRFQRLSDSICSEHSPNPRTLPRLPNMSTEAAVEERLNRVEDCRIRLRVVPGWRQRFRLFVKALVSSGD